MTHELFNAMFERDSIAQAFVREAAARRHGHWMRTYSGRKFWPFDPRADEVCLVDVAHHLSRVCRFGGACREFYSVAQHSVLVSQYLPPELRMAGLLHDAAEAYVGDVIAPIKKSPEFWRDYAFVELRVSRAVCLALADGERTLTQVYDSRVDHVDKATCAAEMRALLSSDESPLELPPPVAGLADDLEPWSPSRAEQEFLLAYGRLS